MLNIWGALGQVARILPNYLEGQRQAVSDNWRDLNMFNQVQAGQLNNMFNERVMPWRINMFGDAANISRWQSLSDTVKGITQLAGSGGQVFNALGGNALNVEQQNLIMQAMRNAVKNAMAPTGQYDGSDILNMFTGGFFQNPQAQQQQQQPMINSQPVTERVTGNTPKPTAAQQMP